MPVTRLDRTRSGRQTSTDPQNLGQDLRAHDTGDDDDAKPPEDKKSTGATDHELPEDWVDSDDEEEADIDYDNMELGALTNMVMEYFCEGDDDEKMLNAMKASVHFTSKVCNLPVLEVASPPVYKEKYKNNWDGSLPCDGHDIIGNNLPRLEYYISHDLRLYFEEKSKAYIKQKKDWDYCKTGICEALSLSTTRSKVSLVYDVGHELGRQEDS